MPPPRKAKIRKLHERIHLFESKRSDLLLQGVNVDEFKLLRCLVYAKDDPVDTCPVKDCTEMKTASIGPY